MSKITKFFDIYGMKCHSCELSVEHEINKLKVLLREWLDIIKNS